MNPNDKHPLPDSELANAIDYIQNGRRGHWTSPNNPDELVLTAAKQALEQPQELCSQCKRYHDPSLIESGECIFCIAQDFKKQIETSREGLKHWKASSESWESTAKLDRKLPCGHHDTLAYDKKGDGSWSVIACKICELEQQSREKDELIERLVEALAEPILGQHWFEYLLLQFPTTRGHLPLKKFFFKQRDALSIAHSKGYGNPNG